jgi:hypothetical protein
MNEVPIDWRFAARNDKLLREPLRFDVFVWQEIKVIGSGRRTSVLNAIFQQIFAKISILR